MRGCPTWSSTATSPAARARPRRGACRTTCANRARYQLTQRGELVHRQVEELLGHAETAREVSSEMLGGILRGPDRLGATARRGLGAVDPERARPRDRHRLRPVRPARAQHPGVLHLPHPGAHPLRPRARRVPGVQDGPARLPPALRRRDLPAHAADRRRHRRLDPARPRPVCARQRRRSASLDLEGRAARRAPGL